MDPVTAIGLVASVVQLAAFGATVARTGVEIYKSSLSMSASNEKLSDTTSQLESLSATLHKRLSHAPRDTQGLEESDYAVIKAAKTCMSRARELKTELDRISAKKSKHKVSWAVYSSLKTLLKDSKIRELAEKLRDSQALLESAVLVGLSQRLTTVDDKQLGIIEQLDIASLQQQCDFRSLHAGFMSLNEKFAEAKNRLVEQGLRTEALVSANHVQSMSRLDQDRYERWRYDLLQSLSFPSLNTREETITGAYPDTYQWLLDESDQRSRNWHSFVAWLRGDEPIYWINGKLGSGKSTLVKYIANECKDHVRDLLCEPLHGECGEPTILKYFFWKNGAPEQRTLSGMLRSVVRQLLATHYGLAAHLNGSRTLSLPVWDTHETLACFKDLLRELIASSGPARICLFIDGLDECQDEDQRPLMTTILDLATTESLKLCLSSRPENLFDELLGNRPRLRLQDLTSQDLHRFVTGEIQRSASRPLLQDTEMSNLVSQTCERADGIFLWAAIVVQDLLEGITDGDNVEMLLDRLREKERSLDGLFGQMLGKTRPIHRKKTAQYLQLLLSGPMSIWDVFLLEDGANILKKLPSNAWPNDGGAPAFDYLMDIFQLVKKRVLSRCCGLVSINDYDPFGYPHSSNHGPRFDRTRCSCIETDFGRKGFGEVEDPIIPLRKFSRTKALCSHIHDCNRLDWIHRSAADFVRESDIAQELFQECKYSLRAAYVDTHTLILQDLASIRYSFFEDLRSASLQITYSPAANFFFRVQEVSEEIVYNLETLQQLKDVNFDVLAKILEEADHALYSKALECYPDNVDDSGEQAYHKYEKTLEGVFPGIVTVDLLLLLLRNARMPDLALHWVRETSVAARRYWSSWALVLAQAPLSHSMDPLVLPPLRFFESLMALEPDVNAQLPPNFWNCPVIFIGPQDPVVETFPRLESSVEDIPPGFLGFSNERLSPSISERLTFLRMMPSRSNYHIAKFGPRTAWQHILLSSLSEVLKLWFRHEDRDKDRFQNLRNVAAIVLAGRADRSTFLEVPVITDAYQFYVAVPAAYVLRHLDAVGSDFEKETGREEKELTVTRVRVQCPDCHTAALWQDINAEDGKILGEFAQSALNFIAAPIQAREAPASGDGRGHEWRETINGLVRKLDQTSMPDPQVGCDCSAARKVSQLEQRKEMPRNRLFLGQGTALTDLKPSKDDPYPNIERNFRQEGPYRALPKRTASLDALRSAAWVYGNELSQQKQIISSGKVLHRHESIKFDGSGRPTRT